MTVSGILEGYLTLYGWQVYASIFLLLVATGAVLYPVARIVFDIAMGYGEGGSSPEAGARSLIIRLAIYMLVLVLGLVPIVPLHLTAIQVQNSCAREGLATLGQKVDFINNNEYGFGEVQDARVPLLPYLAMILASGFNAVMNQAIPCVQDLTNLSLAMNTVNFSEAENPAALRAAIDRFEQECGQRAQRIAVGFLSGEYGDRFQKYMEELLNQYADNEAERRVQLAYFGSRFYRENFYTQCGSGGDPNTPEGKLCGMIAPLRAQNPVDGFPYDAARDTDVSQYQAATGQGLPTCEEWWNDPAHGLRAQLIEAGGESLKNQSMALNLGTCPVAALLPNALCTLIASQMHDIQDAQDVVVQQMLLSSKRTLLGDKTPEITTGNLLLGGALFAFSDVGQAVAANAAGYRVAIYLMKLGSSLLQPFLLMAVFLLWGVYLVIGELRGMTLIKGMMLIFVFSILPSIWAFADHVDDLLFLALYPDTEAFSITSIPKALLTEHSTIERILMTFVTGVFYLFLPLLMLYLVAEAGGPSGNMMAGAAVTDPARNIGDIGGGAMRGARLGGGVGGKAVTAAVTRGKG